ncbi:hypothetical protein N5923_14255 [Erwiniaceae bacterium BAC15a-03b]|uniref:Uncharacterized protein n=1 Tax=Winslowiella arboricola TaxID=2978220 RepID=A0A9J6PPI1_9GAMM|nr:hypothetical protein [Winslowiella arboricola]MCU5772620.1 hypothetical protein [Winslowiella arboricola]MCU5778654.1 hypothetical protein [Winslowiella arboricola]
MPLYLSTEFQEFPHGGYIAHRFDFCIGKDKFVVIFAEVDTVSSEYHSFRSEEVGFSIPPHCYDVKFDRLENFEQGSFYESPTKGQCSKQITFAAKLAEALETIITLHHNIYYARAYFAIAETDKLKRFYDRILQRPLHDIVYEVSTGLGEGGMGYALKTRYFNH